MSWEANVKAVERYKDLAETRELFTIETHKFLDPNLSSKDWQDLHVCIHAECYYAKCFGMQVSDRVNYLQYNQDVNLKLSSFLSKRIQREELNSAKVWCKNPYFSKSNFEEPITFREICGDKNYLVSIKSGIFIGEYSTSFFGKSVCTLVRPLIECSGNIQTINYESLNESIRVGMATYLES